MKVLISGGGTGGHFFPALAVAESLKEKGVEVIFVGSLHGIEYRKRELLKDFKAYFFPSKGVVGKGLKIFPNLFSNSLAFLKTFRLFQKENPDKVLIFGGYASLTSGLVAAALRVPLFLQEQNSVPGRTNLFLSKFSKEVFLGFKSAAKWFLGKGIYTGNPLRREVLEGRKRRKELREKFLKRFSLSLDRKTLLVFGGSQGALWINEKMMEVFEGLLPFKEKFQVIHLTGGKLDKELKRFYKEKGFLSVVLPFYEKMWEVYSAADCAVSRSGAMAVSELSFFQIPTLFVPFPFAAGNHQYYNALELFKAGGCFLEEQKSYSKTKFSELIKALLFDIMVAEKFTKVMASFSVPNSSSLIVERVLNG